MNFPECPWSGCKRPASYHAPKHPDGLTCKQHSWWDGMDHEEHPVKLAGVKQPPLTAEHLRHCFKLAEERQAWYDRNPPGTKNNPISIPLRVYNDLVRHGCAGSDYYVTFGTDAREFCPGCGKEIRPTHNQETHHTTKELWHTVCLDEGPDLA